MDNLKFLLQLYFKPAAGMSDIMDDGSWLFATVGVVLLSFGLGFAINSKIVEAYDVTNVGAAFENVSIDLGTDETVAAPAKNEFIGQYRPFPVIGNAIFWLFSFSSSFITPLIVLSLFYFPGTILTASIVGKLGNPGVVMRRDYATFSTCGLMAWIAAHLPFIAGALFLYNSGLDASVFLFFWLASGAVFGGLLVFALRTVFGLDYLSAGITVGVSWIFYSAGIIAVQFIGPWLFSPFLILFAILFFGGFLSGQVSGLGNSMRDKRNFKRFLHNATVNPNDADAHVQLGLIYAQRRQDEKALEHFQRAFEIDNEEIDANFELGKIARRSGELQKAIEHFSVVVEQNDKYALSDVWREIGVTYLDAGMPKEAREALEKFVSRRAFDSEGLYYLGKVLKDAGDTEEANELFKRAVEAANTAPYYRKKELMKWSRLAAKEIG